MSENPFRKELAAVKKAAAEEKKELVGLLGQTLGEISKLCDQDKHGKKFSGLWDLHAKICQVLDRVDP